MKKIFTLCFTGLLFTGFWAKAGTPTLDGFITAEDGWGPAVGMGNNIAGWANANAQKVYITADPNYIYLAAEFTSESWQQFIFVVNTKDGGGRTDPWGRAISYDHTNAPDFLFRGDIAKGNYAEYQVWSGSAWVNTGVNANASGNEVKSAFFGTTDRNFPGNFAGTVELRIPIALFGGSASSADLQFIIGGDTGGTDNGHGCFDAVPDDNNGTAWGAPGNFTRVSKYISGAALPVSLAGFAGELRNGNVQLNWKTLTEVNMASFDVEQSYDARTWTKAGTVKASNAANGAAYNFTINNMTAPFVLYRLRLMNKDGSYSYSSQVTIKAKSSQSIELIGNPVRGSIKLGIHQNKAEMFTAELLNMGGKRMSNTMYQHGGGSSVMDINVFGMAAGTYLLKVNSKSTGTQTLKVIVQ